MLLSRRPTLAWFAPVLVLLLGWWIFLASLGFESMWHDEYITWNIASRPDFASFAAMFPLGTGHPPGWFFWTWAWVRFTGTENLFVMRLAAAFPALLALAMVYRVGWEWFRQRWLALGAMTFLATSGLMVYYARELRMYTLIVLLVITGWWLFRRALKGERWAVIGYGLIVAAMAYTHYLSAFIVVAQLLVALVFFGRRTLRLFPAYTLAAVLVSLWLPSFLTQMEAASARAGREGSVGQFDGNVPTSLKAVGEFVELYSAGQIAFVAGLVVLALVLGLSRANSHVYRQRVLMLCVWLFVTVGLVMIINLRVPMYNPRYLLTVLPALALLVGVAVAQLPARAWLPLVLVIAVSGATTHTAAFKPRHTPHRELLTTIFDRRLPGDRIWYNMDFGALGSTTDSEIRYYLEQVTPIDSDEFVWDAPDDFEDPDTRRVWDVRPYWLPMPPEAQETLLANRVETEEWIFSDYSVRLYEPIPDTPPARFGNLFALRWGTAQPIAQRGETLQLKLWWQALAPVPLDYSYGLYLRDAEGRVVGQADGGLVLNESIPTSGWPVDETYRLAAVPFIIPADLAPGTYSLWLGVYYWETPQPLPIQAEDAQTDIDSGANILRIVEITVQ